MYLSNDTTIMNITAIGKKINVVKVICTNEKKGNKKCMSTSIKQSKTIILSPSWHDQQAYHVRRGS